MLYIWEFDQLFGNSNKCDIYDQHLLLYFILFLFSFLLFFGGGRHISSHFPPSHVPLERKNRHNEKQKRVEKFRKHQAKHMPKDFTISLEFLFR